MSSRLTPRQRLRRQHDPRHGDRPSARLAVSALVALLVEVLRAARAGRSARDGHDWRRATSVHEGGGGVPRVARVDGACRGVWSHLLTAAGLRGAAAAGRGGRSRPAYQAAAAVVLWDPRAARWRWRRSWPPQVVAVF